MQRNNRLAVFEHVTHKDRTKVGLKVAKRAKSPDNVYEENNTNKTKKFRRGFQVNSEPLNLYCKYNCDFMTDKYNDFLNHLRAHVEDLEDLYDEYQCEWENCTFKSSCKTTLVQHVNFHGYHAKLKNIGCILEDRISLPACNQTVLFQVPTLPSSYSCEWTDCDAHFKEYQRFLDHIKCHVNCKEDNIRCKWQGCKNKYPTTNKLQDHMKTHTKEKLVACPTCGYMFASKTKLIDHRKRQLSSELQGYQCSQCSKLFASERLLRDHMRVHINHYKCHLCDMTCSKPSMLAKHIRYRHLPDRPFKCDICTHSTVSYQDLVTHRGSHDVDKWLRCKNCDFKCRSRWAYTKHQSKEHDEDWDARYACHCCEKMFTRGALLTRHLIKVHDFHWPSGHSRFLYKQDVKSGLFHLQVVRYESLEVTQEMIEGNAAYQQALTKNYKYECKHSSDDPLSFELRIADKSAQAESTSTSDGDGFKYEFIEMDNAAYESDDTDNLIICS